MHPKISRWLENSARILKNRIAGNDTTANQYLDELNLRREMVAATSTVFPKVTHQSIQGVYQVVGANALNAERGYIGFLTLYVADNRIFASWLIEGEDVQTGFGFLNGNLLSIAFEYQADENFYTGVVTYEFLSDSMVLGRWMEEGTDTEGFENGRKLPEHKDNPLHYFGLN